MKFTGLTDLQIDEDHLKSTVQYHLEDYCSVVHALCVSIGWSVQSFLALEAIMSNCDSDGR